MKNLPGIKRVLPGVLFLSALTTGFAAKTIYIPQSVDGAGFSMLFSVSNPGPLTATGTLTIFDQNGAPQPLPFSTGVASQLSITLAANSTKVFTTDGSSNPARVGFAAIQFDQDAVTGLAIFRGAGFEASVLPTSPARKFAMFVERSSTLDTGLSVVKLASGVEITLTLYDNNGNTAAARPYQFPGLKDAKFFSELFPSLPAAFQGMLVIEATGDIAPIGLRFGGGILSTVPLVDITVGLPAIFSVSPIAASQGQTIGSFTVSGANFQAGSTIAFSGSGVTVSSYASRTATQIVASIVVAGNAALGARDVVVTNPDFKQAALIAGFNVIPPAVPAIEVTPATLGFGNVDPGQTGSLSLTVRNNGTATLTVTSIASSNAVFRATAPSVPFTVAAGGQQTVSIQFSPTAPGVQSGTLTITSSDPAKPSIAVSMTGAGLASSNTPPTIGAVTATRDAATNSITYLIPLSDPDGDILRVDLTFLDSTNRVLGGDFFASPDNINLAGIKFITIQFTERFPAGPLVSSIASVRIQATDSFSNKSNIVVVGF